MTTILADVFERRSGIPTLLSDLGAQVEVKRLPAGDYLVAEGTLVERKHVIDLHESLVKGRLWAQIEQLRKLAATAYLLVEGRELAGPVSAKAIRGVLLSVGDLGVTVIRSIDCGDSAAWLYDLGHRRELGFRGRVRPRYAQRPKAPVERVPEAMLASVPGVSHATAKSLLASFGSIAAIVAASPNDWQRVPGVGRRRASALAEAVGSTIGTSLSAEQKGHRAT